jgi:ankyrin repeat protein
MKVRTTRKKYGAGGVARNTRKRRTRAKPPRLPKLADGATARQTAGAESDEEDGEDEFEDEDEEEEDEEMDDEEDEMYEKEIELKRLVDTGASKIKMTEEEKKRKRASRHKKLKKMKRELGLLLIRLDLSDYEQIKRIITKEPSLINKKIIDPRHMDLDRKNINKKEGKLNSFTPLYLLCEQAVTKNIDYLFETDNINSADIKQMFMYFKNIHRHEKIEAADLLVRFKAMIARSFLKLNKDDIKLKHDDDEEDHSSDEYKLKNVITVDYISFFLNMLIVKFGAKINKKSSDGLYPLHALMYNRDLIVAHMIYKKLTTEFSVDKSAKDVRNNNAIHHAVIADNVYMIRNLNEDNVNINEQNVDGDTPLHIAVRRNNIETVECLLRLGAATNIKNLKGETPLYAAITPKDYEYNYELIELLINKCANIDININSADKTPYELVIDETNVNKNRVKVRDLFNSVGIKKDYGEYYENKKQNKEYLKEVTAQEIKNTKLYELVPNSRYAKDGNRVYKNKETGTLMFEDGTYVFPYWFF